jgi:hypothetical protein
MKPILQNFFRKLTRAEAEDFRAFARANPPEDMDKWYIYHPVCRDEWNILGKGSSSLTVCAEESRLARYFTED